jgi:hypothetical protein
MAKWINILKVTIFSIIPAAVINNSRPLAPACVKKKELENLFQLLTK